MGRQAFRGRDVEALVLVAMDVARRAIALAGEGFDQRESSLRLVTGGEESERPASVRNAKGS